MSENENKIELEVNLEKKENYLNQKEFIIFNNQLTSLKKNNENMLSECKENKRLLDLKYDNLNNILNRIQTSVIFVSTFSGFMQSTKEYFETSTSVVSIISITISTYITLLLSISKYYKLDETKERIHNLREKYATLHNKIEYRMDILEPWCCHELWEYQNGEEKLKEWNEVIKNMNAEYNNLIETKQNLFTEFEIIMDSKSRNYYHIVNREMNLSNKQKLHDLTLKENKIETNL